MPAAQWTTKEQYKWLQEQLPEYIALHGEDKDYAHFWAKTHLYWFKSWPERAALFPDIPIEIPLTEEQQAEELAAEKTRKVVSCRMFWQLLTANQNPGSDCRPGSVGGQTRPRKIVASRRKSPYLKAHCCRSRAQNLSKKSTWIWSTMNGSNL